jgi:hypothetical protein
VFEYFDETINGFTSSLMISHAFNIAHAVFLSLKICYSFHDSVGHQVRNLLHKRGSSPTHIHLSPSSPNPIKIRRILHQPPLLNLRNLPNKRLVPRLHYLMKQHPLRLAIKHQTTRMSMECRSTRHISKCAIWLHLRGVREETSC